MIIVGLNMVDCLYNSHMLQSSKQLQTVFSHAISLAMFQIIC